MGGRKNIVGSGVGGGFGQVTGSQPHKIKIALILMGSRPLFNKILRLRTSPLFKYSAVRCIDVDYISRIKPSCNAMRL